MSDSFEPQPKKEARVEAPVKAAPKAEAKKEEKSAAKTPANESAVAARAAAATRGLAKKGIDGLKREAAEASSVHRGQVLADKFIARAAQRNS